MLGPPNHGSLAALTLADNGAVPGRSPARPGSNWAATGPSWKANWPRPPSSSASSPAARETTRATTRCCPATTTASISVDTTKLAGAADFVVVPVLHSFMMDDDKVQQYTLRFLQHGYFISAEQRQPLRTD